MSKSIKNQIQLINQAINTAANAMNLAKQLLRELETVPLGQGGTEDIPGIIGTFKGEYMETDQGEKYPVPQNYASKSGLVYGDTLKRMAVNGAETFKQVQRVKRDRVKGMIVKKEGKWTLVASDGSYSLLDASVSHFNAKEGDEALGEIPFGKKNVPFAALVMPNSNVAFLSEAPKKEEAKKVEEGNKEEKEKVKKPDKKKGLVNRGMSLTEEEKRPLTTLSDEDLR